MKEFSLPRLRQLHGALCLLGLIEVAGCRNGTSAPISAGTPARERAPSARLVLITDLGGVIEPCGCTRDQLGGVSHFAAWLSRERTRVAGTLIASAGPQFFMNTHLSGDGADQARSKATAIANLMRTLDWASFAPASSDWADGAKQLATLAEKSGATPLTQVVTQEDTATAPWATVSVREVGGLRVGFVGVRSQAGPDALPRPQTSVRLGFERARALGANVVVALATVGRGEAKRIADAVPELLAVVVGSAQATGEENIPAAEPERVGNVAIVQAGNHLQSVAVIDLYLRAPVDPSAAITLSDATGIDLAGARSAVERRRQDLRAKVARWERDPSVLASDLQARRQDLADLDAEARRLEAAPPPATGNYYRYAIQEIRDGLGSDPAAERELLAYYKAINEHNRTAFADRLPIQPGPAEASYVGDGVCAKCHADARDFWSRTSHASAYATLERSFKEFNLECVGCHVTGYGKAGGSTVVHVEKLKNVQCEACHGPGSKHASGLSLSSIVAAPAPSTCLECHRPPHVENFDPAQHMPAILGPGHGHPKP